MLVTVGMQMPFDRLVRTIDAWAGRCGRTDAFAQIGDTDFAPAHIDHAPFLDPRDFRARLASCSAVVTHAGMGTILTALAFARPVVILPRRGALRETRNDHQVATATSLADTAGITVAWNEGELFGILDRVGQLTPPKQIGPHASEDLITALRRFIGVVPDVDDLETAAPSDVIGRIDARHDRRRAA
ncbi:MAG: glycosyl transferase family 28 [Planctomycetes bacterium]|nr:glycosyl transferase family 28 [Planctomycetota bacterium]